MPKVYFVTLPDGYFGSAVRSWKTFKIDDISKKLKESDYKVFEVTIDKILELDLKQEDFLVYTSSDEKNIRKYIQDVLYFVQHKVNLVPSYDVLMAHENKGFQELFRKQNKFGGLKGSYHFDKDLLPRNYPFVFKTVMGSGSSGVELVKSDSDLKLIQKRYFLTTIKRKAINYIRSKQLSEREYDTYLYRHKGHTRYVCQEFVPDLTCDYRVLIFFDKYYVMRRDVRENDFRASGSKKFDYRDAPKEVLSFAREVYSHIDSPYASLDVALDKKMSCSLIEYQGMNFGSSALRNSEGYHCWDSKKESWNYIKGKSILEDEFSNAIYSHINNKIK